MQDNTPVIRNGRKYKPRPPKQPPRLTVGHWYTIFPDRDDLRTYGKCVANLPRGRAELELRSGATLIVDRGTVELSVRRTRRSPDAETPPG